MISAWPLGQCLWCHQKGLWCKVRCKLQEQISSQRIKVLFCPAKGKHPLPTLPPPPVMAEQDHHSFPRWSWLVLKGSFAAATKTQWGSASGTGLHWALDVWGMHPHCCSSVLQWPHQNGRNTDVYLGKRGDQEGLEKYWLYKVIICELDQKRGWRNTEH